MGFMVKTEPLPVGTRVRVYDAVTRGSATGNVIRGSAKQITVQLHDTFQDPMVFTLRNSGRWIRRYQPDAWDSLRVWRAIA
jgi:hypothetical protein